MELRIALLGGLRVQTDDQVPQRFRTRRAESLLARLAFRIGDRISRDELAELLWPDSDPGASRSRLSVELNGLRNILRRAAGGPSTDPFKSDREFISLNPEVVETDVQQFEALIRRASRLSDASALVDTLSEAVDAYGGRLLPEIFDDWIEPERERLANQYFYGVMRLAPLLEQRGSRDAALAAARGLTELDPYREEAHTLIMGLELAAGRRSSALKQYDILKRLLADLGDTPGGEASRLRIQAREAIQAVKEAPVGVSAPSAEAAGQIIRHGQPLPSGTVTFLNTDIVKSSRHALRDNEAYQAARRRHLEILRESLRRYDGFDFKDTGDGLMVAFERARDAVHCAIDAQRRLCAEPWPREIAEFAVRMGIHTADALPENGDYHCIGVNQLARFAGAANAAQILITEATRTVLAAELSGAYALRDWGPFLIKDVREPRRLYQPIYAGLPDSAVKAPAARRPNPINLPPTYDQFFGREAEIQVIASRLAAAETRLVTLTGAGGTGKTRLSLETSRRIAARFDDAVWFVPLEALIAASQIAPAALARAGIEPDDDNDPIDLLGSKLAGRHGLLILDNMEHLLPEAAGVIGRILETCPGLKLLVTSRQRLGLASEIEVDVAPLSAPGGEEKRRGSGQAAARIDVEAIRRNESVALFEDRARRIKQGFRIDERNAAAVAEICRRVDGIPLAIEFAASWVKVINPAGMLTHLKSIMVSQRTDVSPRHRSLTSVMEASYQLLSSELQRFFAALSVFRGGWTMEAAIAVGGTPESLSFTSQLLDRSLIRSYEDGDEMRYGMLEPVREFAEEKLESQGSKAEAKQRHLEFYLAMTREADDELLGSNQAEWLSRIETEFRNIEAAHASADRDTGLEIAYDLFRYWHVRGRRSTGLSWLESGIDVIPEPQTDCHERAFTTAGLLAGFVGRYQDAEQYLGRALEYNAKTGDDLKKAISLNSLAGLAAQQGEPARALVMYEACQDIWRRRGVVRQMAVTLSNIGAMAIELRDYDLAKSVLHETMTISGGPRDELLRSNILENLSYVLTELGDIPEAVAALDECLKVRVAIGDSSRLPSMLSIAASCAGKQNRHLVEYECLTNAINLSSEHSGCLSDEECLKITSRMSELREEGCAAESHEFHRVVAPSIADAAPPIHELLLLLSERSVNG